MSPFDNRILKSGWSVAKHFCSRTEAITVYKSLIEIYETPEIFCPSDRKILSAFVSLVWCSRQLPATAQKYVSLYATWRLLFDDLSKVLKKRIHQARAFMHKMQQPVEGLLLIRMEGISV